MKYEVYKISWNCQNSYTVCFIRFLFYLKFIIEIYKNVFYKNFILLRIVNVIFFLIFEYSEL